MPWFIVRTGRLPVADQHPFATREEATAAAAGRYPDADCQIVEADITMDALRLVTEAARRKPGSSIEAISPRLRADREPDRPRGPENRR